MKKIARKTAKKTTKQTLNKGKMAMEIGAGLAATAAAGYYFYASPKASNHRKIAAKWASAMHAEVVREAKKLDKASPKAIIAIVDKVVKTYQNIRSIDKTEVLRAAKEIKANAAIVLNGKGKKRK